MVITSSFSSIKGFILTRPPLVLFTLCLMAFAVTTFSFAYYVEHNEKIPNLDAYRNWVSFLSHLSKRRLCISSSEGSQISQIYVGNNHSEAETLESVYVAAKLKSKNVLNNFTHIEGLISMSDWVSECNIVSVEQVKVSFSIPTSGFNTSENEIDICVMITAPYSIVAPGIHSGQCSSSHTVTIVLGHIYKAISEKKDVCSNENVHSTQYAEISYEPSKYNGVSLTTHDRSIINLHLFHTSYFLLVMAITLICYAMIKGKPITKQQSPDKTVLDM